MFGVTNETKVGGVYPFAPTQERPITLGYLTEVKAEERSIENGDKSGTKTMVLVFKFTDFKKERFFTHTEWNPSGDTKEETKIAGLNSRIGHIFVQFADIPEKGLGTGSKTFEEYIKAIALAFNGKKEEDKIFKDVPIWIKVAYSKKYAKKGLQFPLLPNFVERAIKQGDKFANTKLAINNLYETIVQPEADDNSVIPTSSANNTDYPSF